MSEVHVKENESLESALKRFKRSCAKAGVIQEYKKKEAKAAEAESTGDENNENKNNKR